MYEGEKRKPYKRSADNLFSSLWLASQEIMKSSYFRKLKQPLFLPLSTWQVCEVKFPVCDSNGTNDRIFA